MSWLHIFPLLAASAATVAVTEAPIPAGNPENAELIKLQQERYERVTVPVTIKGQGPVRFMVDTGAQATVVSSALAEASGRTLEISRVHRSLTSDHNDALDFQSFAAQLLKNTLEARGQSTSGIILDATGVRLTADQATSVGLVILECLNGRLGGPDEGSLRIHMRGDDKEVRLEVCRSLEGTQAYIQPASPYLLTAMVEQLSGRFTERADAEGSTMELVFPRIPTPVGAPTAPFLNSAAPTFH